MKTCNATTRVLTILTLAVVCRTASATTYGTLEHKRFRWRNDDGDEATATWAGDEIEAIYVDKRYEPIRIRFALGTDDDDVDTGRLKLQYCESVDNGVGHYLKWKDVPLEDDGLTPFVLMPAQGYANGELTTDLLKAKKNLNSSIVSMIWQSGGQCVEKPDMDTTALTVLSNRYINVEYCIAATHKAEGGMEGYFFRAATSETQTVSFELNPWKLKAPSTWYPAIIVGDADSGIPPSFQSNYTVNAKTYANVNHRLYIKGSEPIDYEIVSGPTWLKMDIFAEDYLTGTPPATGSYTATIRASNEYGTVDGTITIAVTAGTPPDDPGPGSPIPTAYNASVSCSSNSWDFITHPTSDADTPIEELSLIFVSGPSHGSADYLGFVDGKHLVKYTPATNWSGADSYTFKFSDGVNQSQVATSTVSVTYNRYPPYFYDSNVREVNVVVDADHEWGKLMIPVVPRSTEGYTGKDDYEYIIVDEPSNGCEVRPQFGHGYKGRYMEFWAPTGYTGISTFTYKVSDGMFESPVDTVRVTVHQNTKPKLCGASYWIPLGTDPDAMKLPHGGYSSYFNTFVRINDPDLFSLDGVRYDIVTPPMHGTLDLPDPTQVDFTYVPDDGFIGEDYAYVSIFDGLEWSDPARLRFIVREGGTPAGARVNILVEEAMLNEIRPEVQRMKTDMENEGWTAEIVPVTPAMTAQDVWQLLRDDYLDESKCLAGCVLIGAVPVPGNPHNYRQLWFYRDADVNDTCTDIFVSYYMGGATVPQMRNALDANHQYRIGMSRIGQKFMKDYDSRDFSDRSGGTILQEIWPDMTSYEVGGRRFNDDGYEAVYMLEHDGGGGGGYSSTYTASYDSTPELFRFWFDEGCGSGNRQRGRLYSHGGQALLVTGNAATWGGGSVCNAIARTRPAPYMLSHGGSYGAAFMAGAITEWPNFHYDYRHWGDLTIQPIMNPPNGGPRITQFSSDKSVVGMNEPVTLTMAATDPDAAETNSPFVDYEFLFEVMVNNRMAAMVTSVDGTATNTLRFDKPHYYSVNIHVADEWTYRTWSGAKGFAVAPDSTQPLRINCGVTDEDLYDSTGRLWLYDQGYRAGTYGVSSSKSATGSTGYGVAGTTEDFLYQTYRESRSENAADDRHWVKYYVPLSNGTYTVTLKLADMHSSAAGQRLLDVTIENELWLDDFDVYAVAGPKTAYDISTTVDITDGQLRLAYIRATNATANAYVNAIEITPQSPVEPPKCVLTAPRGRCITGLPGTVAIAADAMDPDGSVQQVEFYVDDVLVATDSASPYSCDWAVTEPGYYRVRVIATDNSGAWAADSDLVEVCDAGGGLDTDGDGIPDEQDPDDDNDGVSDVDELIAGTDPLDPRSFFCINGSFMGQGGRLILRWPSATGRLYTIDCSESLVPPVFSALDSNIPARPPENAYTVNIDGASCGFFRIRAQEE